MTKTLLVFATQIEAQACLDYFAPKCDSRNNLYLFDAGYILICGFGNISAAAETAKVAHLVDRIWNIGIAGSLHDHLKVGTIQEISSISKHLSFFPNLDQHSKDLSQRTFPTVPLREKGLRLMSSDYPIYLPALRKQLSQVADLIDMEGYGIAFAAKANQKECQQWKLISDLASPNNWKQIIENMPALSKQMLDLVIRLLDL